jgi:hypothetical protein
MKGDTASIQSVLLRNAFVKTCLKRTHDKCLFKHPCFVSRGISFQLQQGHRIGLVICSEGLEHFSYHTLEGTCRLHRYGRNNKFWEELIAYFPLIRHKPHRKGRVQQFIYRWVFIRCGGNVFTEPLPSNDRGMHIDTKTYERDSWGRQLKWAQVPWHTYCNGFDQRVARQQLCKHGPTRNNRGSVVFFLYA